jgi:hypothetical protein
MLSTPPERDLCVWEEKGDEIVTKEAGRRGKWTILVSIVQV